MKAKANKGEVLSACCKATAGVVLDSENKPAWGCTKCKKFFEAKPMFSKTETVRVLLGEIESGVLQGVYGTKNKVTLLMKLKHIKELL